MRNFTKTVHQIDAEFVDLTNQAAFEKSLTDKTVLVWIETPTNPTLKVIDIKAIVDAVRKRRGNNCIVLVDNTFATMYLQSPLEFGADIVSHSVSKYIGGHSDIIMGALVCNDKALYDKLTFNAKSIGANPSVFDCYLALRGLKTLESRMKLHTKNAYALAHYLDAHPLIENVYYPGLKQHPQHEIVKR